MLANWTKATTTTTGTGTITLTAVTGYPLPSKSRVTGEYVQYSIHTSDAKFESGIGKIGASETLERTSVRSTYDGTTYNQLTASALSLASGTHDVFITPMAEGTFQPLMFPLTGPTTPVLHSTHLQSAPANDSGLVARERTTAFPFRLETSGLCTAMGIYVAAAGTASTLLLGLYEPDSTGNPGRLICKISSNIDSSTSGWKSQTLDANVWLQPGWYWAALNVNAGSTTPTFTSLTQNASAFCHAAGSNGGLQRVYENATATTLADPFPSTTLIYTTENSPKSPKICLIF